MAYLPEESIWEDGVRAIEKTDPVVDTVYNVSFQQLANRTKWLKDNSGSSFAEVMEVNSQYSEIEPEDIGKLIILNMSTNYFSVKTYWDSLGDIGDEIHFLLANCDYVYEESDKEYYFFSEHEGVSGQRNPITAQGFVPAFRAPYSIVTMKKIKEDPSGHGGFGDWIMFGDLAQGEMPCPE